jgi:tetratricopeptide (TPR) repeat protein
MFKFTAKHFIIILLILLILGFGLYTLPNVKADDETKTEKSHQGLLITEIKREIEELQLKIEGDKNNRSSKIRLVTLLCNIGHYNAAEKLLNELSPLEGPREFIIGMNFYELQARYEKAKELGKEILLAFMPSSWNENEDTAITLKNLLEIGDLRTAQWVILYRIRLGALLHQQGFIHEAEKIFFDTQSILGAFLNKIDCSDDYSCRSKNFPFEASKFNKLEVDNISRVWIETIFRGGILYKDISRFSKAEAVFKWVFKNGIHSSHNDLLGLRYELSEVYRIQGRYAEAESLANEIIELISEESPYYPNAMVLLSMIKHEQGLLKEAERHYKDAYSYGKVLLGNDHPYLGIILTKTACLYIDLERFNEPEMLLNNALSIQKSSLDSDHPLICETLRILASVYFNKKNYKDSEKILESAIGMLKNRFGEYNFKTVPFLNDLAASKCHIGLLNEAEKIIESAIIILKRTSLTETIEMANCLGTLAEIRLAKNNVMEAKKILLSKLEIQKKMLVSDHRDILSTKNAISSLSI